MGCRINPVRSKPYLHQGIGLKAEILLCRSTHNSLSRKNHNSIMRCSYSQFILCTNHPCTLHSPYLCSLKLHLLSRGKSKSSTHLCHQYLLSFGHIGCSANNLEKFGLTCIHLCKAQLICIRMLSTLHNLTHYHSVKRSRNLFHTLHCLYLKPY